MCKSPGILADGTQIACRNCSLCHRRARNDWIGRCIAESKTAKACHVINLTYGRNRHGDVLHERSVLLTYSDVQKFLKLLRRHGYPVRYLVTGEYGNERGRAHWHIILFWQDKVPPFAGWLQSGEWLEKAEEEQRFDWVRLDDETGEAARDSEGNPLFFWPHGFAYWQPVNQRTVQYVCYYVLKELDHEGRQYHLAMSKKPPIGQLYFEQLAERMVEAGIAPQSPEYKFPGVTRHNKAKGKRETIPFWLKDRPLEIFLGHYIAMWAEMKGDQPRPKSDLVDWYERFGKVVHDYEAAFDKLDDEYWAELKWAEKERRAAAGLPDPVGRTRQQPYHYAPWVPFYRLVDWWDEYFKGFGDGEERQRELEDVEYHERLVEKWEQCDQSGVEPSPSWEYNREWYEDVCRALANYHRFESVDEWQRFRQGECVDPSVRVVDDYGPSRLDRLKAGYAAFHSKPDSAGPGEGPSAA